MIRTVNDGLPEGYSGRCDILCNDKNGIVANRNLVILFALMSAGSNLEEVAEFAVHLMYSSALTKPMARLFYRCIAVIYNAATFDITLNTRGKGQLRAVQTADNVRLALATFLSSYDLETALNSMRSIMLNPRREDYRDRYLSGLEAGHRLSFSRYRKSGILVPFSLDVSHFTEPNR